MKTKEELKAPYKFTMTGAFQRLDDKERFLFCDCDVKKGFKWSVTFYSDEAKKRPFLYCTEQKLQMLESAYEFKDAESGKVIGAWVPQKGFLSFFVRARYELVVNGKVVAISPRQSIFSLFLGGLRSMLPRKVVSAADGKKIAKLKSLMGASVTVQPEGDRILEDDIAIAVAVMAVIHVLEH